MLQISFLYASLAEYLFFTNTAIVTEGHTRIFPAKLWDWVLEGESWAYYLGDSERTVSTAGHLGIIEKGGGGGGLCVKDHSTEIEYDRGNIPLMMPSALMDSMFNILDFKSFFGQSWEVVKLTTREILRGHV